MDDEDYMSDKYLKTLDTTRLGLLGPKEKRTHCIKKKSYELKIITKKGYLEKVNREQKLNEPLTKDNIGFKMLSKMGYKEGVGIGKKSKCNEPLFLDIKNDRKGIGNFKKPISSSEQFKNNQLMVNSFKKSYKDKVVLKRLSNNLEKIQSIFVNLQEEFLSQPVIENDDEEKNDDLNKLNIKCKHLISHLRYDYFYCFWCGTKYKDKEDIKNCPGPDEEDH